MNSQIDWHYTDDKGRLVSGGFFYKDTLEVTDYGCDSTNSLSRSNHWVETTYTHDPYWPALLFGAVPTVTRVRYVSDTGINWVNVTHSRKAEIEVARFLEDQIEVRRMTLRDKMRQRRIRREGK
jgi:hypothetical protein